MYERCDVVHLNTLAQNFSAKYLKGQTARHAYSTALKNNYYK